MIKQKGLIIHPDELTDYWVSRFLQTGLNLLGIHPEGGLTGGNSVYRAAEWIKQPETKRLIGKLIDKGVGVEYEIHALSWLLPRDMFDKQPEWFRMNAEGVRVNDYHFCHSNPEPLEYISERAKKAAGVFNPTTKNHHLWLDDTDCDCHCPKCRAQAEEKGCTPSDAAMVVYNAVLDGVKAHDSNARQCYLAYYTTIAAPEKVKPSEGIFLEYAPFHRDLAAPLNDPSSEANRKAIGAIDGLFKVFPKTHSKALDYWLDNSRNSNWKKPVQKLKFHAGTAKSDVGFYNSKGFETVTNFACFLGEEYYLLYNEHADIETYAQIFHDI